MPGYKFFTYINDQLASRTIKTENSSGIEILTIEITKCKNKILVVVIYKPLTTKPLILLLVLRLL